MPYIIWLLSEALMAVTLAALRAPMTRLKKKISEAFSFSDACHYWFS